MNLSLVLGLAARNLFRNTRRTLITSVAVVAGVAVLIVGWGLVDGLDENVIRAQEDTVSGHILLRPGDYPTDGRSFPLSSTQSIDDATLEALSAPSIEAWTPRLIFAVQATLQPPSDPSREVAIETIQVRGFGYDPSREDAVFPRAEWELEGGWPDSGRQIVLGQTLAEMMGVQIGDRIDLKLPKE